MPRLAFRSSLGKAAPRSPDRAAVAGIAEIDGAAVPLSRPVAPGGVQLKRVQSSSSTSRSSCIACFSNHQSFILSAAAIAAFRKRLASGDHSRAGTVIGAPS